MEKLTMENIVTFYPQQGGYIDFSVKRGYYAGASVYENDQSEIVYVPNGTLIGRVADDYITIEPMESVCDSQEYTENRNACTRVDVYRIKDVNENCPKGWSVALVEHKMYGDKYVSMEVKSVLYSRPFQMKEIAKFFRKELSIEEAASSYRKEMNVINIRPMRVFDVTDAYETVPAEREMNQSLTIEEALYVSREHYGMVHSQQPFSFFGENQFPVFYRGELLYTGERRTNDTFKIALPPQEVAFEWSDDEAGDGGDGDEVAYLQILK